MRLSDMAPQRKYVTVPTALHSRDPLDLGTAAVRGITVTYLGPRGREAAIKWDEGPHQHMVDVLPPRRLRPLEEVQAERDRIAAAQAAAQRVEDESAATAKRVLELSRRFGVPIYYRRDPAGYTAILALDSLQIIIDAAARGQ